MRESAEIRLPVDKERENEDVADHSGQLMFELIAMPEFELRQQLQHFVSSQYIFHINFNELERWLLHMIDSSNLTVPTVLINPEFMDRARLEATRLLHNFLASAKTLVDHSLVFYRQMYEAENRFPDYQGRVKEEFLEDPLTQFIQRFRQYSQHYKSPNIGVSEKMSNGEFTRSVYLQKSDLLKFDGWNATAKKYMEGIAGADIDILAVMRAYRDKIQNFYKWFSERQKEIHADELDRLEKKESQFHCSEIEVSINGCLLRNDGSYCSEQAVFFPFSNDAFLQELASMGSDKTKRAERAIEILSSIFRVSDRVKEKIRFLYQQEWFLAS